MIVGRPLTAAEKRESQHNYLCYSAVNGLSYMCLGETVLILFAVQLRCPDTIIAILGGMLYFGFLLLPLGKIMTARVGAVRCQADCWVMRNLAVLIVAAAAPVACWGSRAVAIGLLLAGSFLFYGFRAAGVVMGQPLVAEICDTGAQGRLISRSWLYFYGFGFLALLAISGLLKLNTGVWTIFCIIVAGTVFGITSSGYLRKVYETGQIRDSARKSVFPMLPDVIRSRVIRRQLAAGMVCNLCVILTIPISMLTLKRGYGVSDSQALLFSLVQFGSSIAGAWLLGRIADRFGGRKLALGGFYCFYGIVLCWICAPREMIPWVSVLPFLLCCGGSVVTTTALQQYFIATVPKPQQVVASLLISVATGVFSGLCGMGISSLLLKFSAFCNVSAIPMNTYRIYYAFVLLLLPFLGRVLHRLPRENSF